MVAGSGWFNRFVTHHNSMIGGVGGGRLGRVDQGFGRRGRAVAVAVVAAVALVSCTGDRDAP
ncbi:hypothetical protein C1I95_27310, partial [Micromonospora craterilacus]